MLESEDSDAVTASGLPVVGVAFVPPSRASHLAAGALEAPPTSSVPAAVAIAGADADTDVPLKDGEQANDLATTALGNLLANSEDGEAIVTDGGGGILEKVSSAKGRVSQFVSETTRTLAENERVQQSVNFLRSKTHDLCENERVQKVTSAVSGAADTGVQIAKASVVVGTLAAQGAINTTKEKASQVSEYVKEKGHAVREGAGTVWEKGRGSILKARAKVSVVAWKGSARDTLDICQQQWRDIKVQGAEELTVPARTEHTSTYLVQKGSTLRWTFRVKDYDIGFGVRMRVQEWGGSKEIEVLAVEKYDNADTVSGSWVADENRTLVLSFDNRYSKLRSKTVAYIVGTEKPEVFEATLQGVAASGDAAVAEPYIVPHDESPAPQQTVPAASCAPTASTDAALSVTAAAPSADPPVVRAAGAPAGATSQTGPAMCLAQAASPAAAPLGTFAAATEDSPVETDFVAGASAASIAPSTEPKARALV